MKRFFLILVLFSAAAGCSRIPGSVEQAQPPVFSRAAGIYGLAGPVTVTLSTPTAGAEIRYTLDGATPSSSSLLFSAPISMSEVGKTYRIRAVSICAGMVTSDIAEASYVMVRAGTEDTAYWNKKYNDSVGIGIVVMPNGNVCVVGYVTNTIGTGKEEDAVIKMFSSNGAKLWEKVIGTAVFNDRAIAVDADADGYIYVAGTQKDNTAEVINVDWTLRKIDPSDGTVIWGHVYGGSGNDYMNAVRLDSKKNVYIAGSGYDRALSGTATKDDWWVKKVDSDGNEVSGWDFFFDGNRDEDYINDIIVDSSDNVYIAGCGKNIVAKDSGFDWRVMKLSEAGATVWDRKYDGNKGNDYINSIAIDRSDNSIYLVGNGENIVGSATLADRWIKKLKPDPDGTEDWDQRYDGNGGNDYLNSAVVDSEGYLHVVGAGYVVINGNSNYDWWLERLDRNGNIDTIYPQTLDADNKAYYANTIVVDDRNTYGTGYNEYGEDLNTVEQWWIKKFYR